MHTNDDDELGDTPEVAPLELDVEMQPIDVNTLALPAGVELPQPVEPLLTDPPASLPSLRELAVFCLPTLGIWLSSPLLSLIDTSVVGLSCATHHLAALAPSTMPEEFPAVTVPPSLKTGRRRASDSAVVPERGCSSRSTTIGSPLRWGTDTGAISSAKRPAAIAASARC